MDTVYLDNAATSFPKPAGMSARMKDYMDNIGATINRSVYASAADAGLVALSLRERAKRLFNFNEKATHVIITPGARLCSLMALNSAGYPATARAA